ncbi:MAG TPA: YwiC-like family protein [Opitutaceae bacterium]|nr:YwiC-like family protein [Opitutaceae bacterium]
MTLEAHVLAPAPHPPLPAPKARRPALAPAEHGSWSLALEPLALGLLIAPVRPAILLAVAALAAFLARRPLKLVVRGRDRGPQPLAWAALACAASAAAAAFALELWLFRGAWMVWLAPAGLAGGVYLAFDLRNRGRELVPEIAGAAAFALLPAAMAASAPIPGWAGAPALIACGRSLPTVLLIRTYLRQRRGHLSGTAPAWIAALAAVAVAVILAGAGMGPGLAVVALAALAVRSGIYLNRPHPQVGARFLGVQELVLGAAFALAVGLAWPR